MKQILTTFNKWKRPISISVFIIALFFIYVAVRKSITEIRFSTLTFDWRYLVLASVLSLPITAAASWLWYRILLFLNETPPFICIWRANMYANIMRYVPGRIWNYLGKIHWVSKNGISEKKVLLSSFLDLLFLLIGSSLTALYSIKLFLSPKLIFLLYVGIVLILICIHPGIIQAVINRVGRRWVPAGFTLKFSYTQMLLLTLAYTILWISMGIQLYLIIRSFYPLDIRYLPLLTSINSGAWLIGYISIIAPSGIGVREGTFVLIFKNIAPVSIAVLCALANRLFILVNDLAIALLFLCFDHGAWKKLFTKKDGNSNEKEEN